jgi:hypothetical protein
MRTTIMLAAAAALLAAAPAFAGNGHVPRTDASGPGSAGSIQQQDMQRSAAQTDVNAEALKHWQAQQRDPADPQMTPRNVVNPHH